MKEYNLLFNISIYKLFELLNILSKTDLQNKLDNLTKGYKKNVFTIIPIIIENISKDNAKF